MSRQLDITVQGVVGTNPVLSRVGGGARPYCRFRVAVTPTFRSDSGWQDGDTMWFTAKAWGRLAENTCLSLRKGDPVLLTGRLSEDVWSTDEGTHSTNVITLQSAGHDLTRGESRFARVKPVDAVKDAGDVTEAGDAGDAADAGGAGPAGGGWSAGSADAPAPAPAPAPSASPAQAARGQQAGALPSYHWETGAADGPRTAPDYVLVGAGATGAPDLPAADDAQQPGPVRRSPSGAV